MYKDLCNLFTEIHLGEKWTQDLGLTQIREYLQPIILICIVLIEHSKAIVDTEHY